MYRRRFFQQVFKKENSKKQKNLFLISPPVNVTLSNADLYIKTISSKKDAAPDYIRMATLTVASWHLVYLHTI